MLRIRRFCQLALAIQLAAQFYWRRYAGAAALKRQAISGPDPPPRGA